MKSLSIRTAGFTDSVIRRMTRISNRAIFSPFYENFTAGTILTGAEPVCIPLVPPTFSFDANLLGDAFRNGAKALVLCNPSTPCGKVFSLEELSVMRQLSQP